MTETILKLTTEEIYKTAADKIAEAIIELAKEKDYVVLAVPGGRSVSGTFAELKKHDLPWEKIHIFIVDERLVPIDHEDSNFRLAKQGFIDGLVQEGTLPEENIHPFIFNSETEDKGITDYEQELRMHGGKYHIVLLSSGEDGHIGALYPNHHSINNGSDFFLIMNDSPKPPPDRMTMSRELLSKASVAIIIFAGEGKKEALRLFQDQTTTIEECPAKLVQKVGKSYAITDQKI